MSPTLYGADFALRLLCRRLNSIQIRSGHLRVENEKTCLFSDRGAADRQRRWRTFLVSEGMLQRPVPCAELTKTTLGLMWRGLIIFNDMQTRDSLDQLCHVCVKSYIDFVPYLPICVFIPRVTS
jgi:hypothetical protein